jgi:hypothetical protein
LGKLDKPERDRSLAALMRGARASAGAPLRLRDRDSAGG